MRRVLITILLVQLAACSYKPDVRQGNILEDEVINKLQTGMTTEQVMFLLGSPTLKDTFHKNRWDYIEAFTAGYEPTQRRLLTLYFEGQKLVRIDKSQLDQQKLPEN